jgi:hypothetical protein
MLSVTIGHSKPLNTSAWGQRGKTMTSSLPTKLVSRWTPATCYVATSGAHWLRPGSLGADSMTCGTLDIMLHLIDQH